MVGVLGTVALICKTSRYYRVFIWTIIRVCLSDRLSIKMQLNRGTQLLQLLMKYSH